MPRTVLLLTTLLTSLLFAAPAMAEKRVALVIGNGAYVKSSALANPVNDATEMAKALAEAGFEVIAGLDLDKRTFDIKVRDFARALGDADVALFYYAGHALQVSGRNYLVPVDASMERERDLDFETVGVDFVLRQMEIDRENKTNLVFLDSCRDNPLARNLARSMGTRSASVSQGLAQVQTGVGTFIAYSTQPGNVALDGSGTNSPFTAALVKGMRASERNLTSVMVEVRKDVLAATGGRQVPWDHSSLTGDFFFQRVAAPGALVQPGVPAASDVQKRLEDLERELQRKTDQTGKVVELAQAKERLRQLMEANQDDQRRIFDVQRDHRRSGSDSFQDISRLQIAMVRRSQEIS
ncbi:MAG: caspase family protein, partial [Hyphomicrobium sp.]|nr:caspase family protein [Hyphomicrobium sp.]